ncbi:MAG: hypothetical protein QOH90_1046, partial [Actinomycetota bacterium]|nr:hypothetical protein [Actinomycetota bacterium]
MRPDGESARTKAGAVAYGGVVKKLLSLLLIAGLLTAACSSGPATNESAIPATTRVDGARVAASTADEPFRPAPNKRVPKRGRWIARDLTRVTRDLRDSIDEWVASDGIFGRHPPKLLTLQALYQQRIYRKLGRRDRLFRRTMQHLGTRLARVTRAHHHASKRLRTLVTPIKDPDSFRTGPAAPAGKLLRFYKRAEERFHVAWEVLAAVNFIETKFNKVRSNSSAGAQGPMQFLPSTWEKYGMGGNIRGPHDAIMGAANYLHASGAPDDYRNALYAYNHSDA